MGAVKPRFSPEYRAYMAGDGWKRSKERWHRQNRRWPWRRKPCCRVCKDPRFQLHHARYRLGKERYRDLKPLCSKHHDRLTWWKRRTGLRNSTITPIYIGLHRLVRLVVSPVGAAAIVVALVLGLV